MNINTYLEVNLENLDKNIKAIQEKIGNKEILPVIKANAYGLGVDKILSILEQNNISTVCVALPIEGIGLREFGWKKDILVLNPPFNEDIQDVIENNLISGVSRREYILELNEKAKEQGVIAKVHLEIDTGMGRTGIQEKDIEEYAELLKSCSNISIDGIYTHFSTSDELNSEYMLMQKDCFIRSVEKLQDMEICPKYIHMSNSGAIIQLEDSFATAVRPGLILYGHIVSDEIADGLKIYPTSRLVSRVSFLKYIESGTSIGYGRKHISQKKEKIATVPIGYADGLPRELSNKGHVVINGNVCNVVGNVCMDNILVDVSNVKDINVGDTVYIWDNEKITVEEVAKLANTINYEIVTRVSPRVQRKYC